MVSAQSPPPLYPSVAVVSGWIEINEEYAPSGTIVVAKVSGTEVGNYTLTVDGEYGMVIEGTSEDVGKEIEFYVNGIKAEQTAEWRSMEEPIVLNLSVTMETTSSSTISSTTSTSSSTISDTSSTTSSLGTISDTSSTSSTTSKSEPVIETQKGNESRLALVGILAVILIILVGILIMLIRRK